MFLFCSKENARVNPATTFPPGKSPSIGRLGPKFPKAVESRPLWHLGNIISVQDQILNCLGHWRGLEGTGSNKTKNCGGAEVQERRMKRMLFAGAMMLAATGSTLAADLPPSMPPPPPPRAPAAYVPIAPPMYNWGGIYIGINGGYGFGSSNWSATGTSTGNFNIQGPVAGGTLGANFQTGQFVFGIEGDGDWSNIKGSESTTSTVCPGCQTANTWLATLRARTGVAWDRVLLYATAGGAAGTINTSGLGLPPARTPNSVGPPAAALSLASRTMSPPSSNISMSTCKTAPLLVRLLVAAGPRLPAQPPSRRAWFALV
jgi:outer membrane immunogenic protein